MFLCAQKRLRLQDFLGVVLGYDPETEFALIEQRNKFSCGDLIEFISPTQKPFVQKVEVLINSKNEKVTHAPHPKEILKIKTNYPVGERYILRKVLNLK